MSMEAYKVNGRVYVRAGKKRKQKRERLREIERVRKCFDGNTEPHHRVQLATGKPCAKAWRGEDETIAGDDDQRFVKRSEIE